MPRLPGRLRRPAWLSAGAGAILLLFFLATGGAALADSGGWPTLTPTATLTPSLTPTWTPVLYAGPTITSVPTVGGAIPGPGAAFVTPVVSPKALPTGTLLSGDQILATLQAGGQPQQKATNRNSAVLLVFILLAGGILILGFAYYLWWRGSRQPAPPPENPPYQ